MIDLAESKDYLFDSHCHLNDESFDKDRDEVIKRAKDSGVEEIIDIGVNLRTAEKALKNAKRYPGIVKISVGIDPEFFVPGNDLYNEEVASKDEADLMPLVSVWKSQLGEFINENRQHIAMIGETGLDKHWLAQKVSKGEIPETEAERLFNLQLGLFQMHLELASEFGLPLSVHSRGAEDEVIDLVNVFPDDELQAIFHSFTGTYEQAKQILDMPKLCGLGVNGIVTYPNATEIREMYKKILGNTKDWAPRDFYEKQVYFETDAPYLSPSTKRGKRNEPGNIKDIYEFLIM